MTDLQLFAAALQLSTPWEVKELTFKEMVGSTKNELHITLDYAKGSKFYYEEELCSVYDHQERTWRHLNFFEHDCYLHARVPRVKTKEGNVRLVEVPWAGDHSAFTLKFELLVLDYVRRGMSCLETGRLLNLENKRVFRIIKKHVVTALSEQEIPEVKHLGIDETSSKKGHNYLTILTDREKYRVVGIGVGKDEKAAEEALLEMEIRGGSSKSIRTVTMDMWRAFIAITVSNMPNAEIIFDRFHLMYNLNKKIDKIRKTEQKEFEELKKTKYKWLHNFENLSKEFKVVIKDLSKKYQKIGTAYRLKELFREVMDYAQVDRRLLWLNEWMKEAWNSEIEELQEFVKMLKNHWYGIKTYFKYKASNAMAERINLKIQEIKRIAKGYRNLENYKLIIYLHLGGFIGYD